MPKRRRAATSLGKRRDRSSGPPPSRRRTPPYTSYTEWYRSLGCSTCSTDETAARVCSVVRPRSRTLSPEPPLATPRLDPSGGADPASLWTGPGSIAPEHAADRLQCYTLRCTPAQIARHLGVERRTCPSHVGPESRAVSHCQAEFLMCPFRADRSPVQPTAEQILETRLAS